ncbi:hypothetical protein GC176_24465 [bacterium]|nr:hypothetical protein [bacterium]
MSKLKGVNWKEMILGHGEKVVLGCVVLFVLTTVVSARWGTYGKQPIEFETAVKQQDAAFASSVFPPEERASFDAPDPGDEVDRVLNDETEGSYEYSTVWLSPIYKKKAKLKEPAYVPIEDLVADAGKVLLQLTPEESAAAASQMAVRVDDGAAAESVASATPAVPGVAGPRVDGPRVAPGVTGPAGSSGIGPSGTSDPNYGKAPAYPGGNPGGSSAGAYPGSEYTGLPGSGGYPGAGGYGMGMGSNLEARGARFVAIRGVFPHKALVQNYKKALNTETIQEAAQNIEFWDFELERKTAIPGAADPWSGNWEPVDVEVAVELLARTDFDIDVVSDEYRDSVFTMPLPYRVTGDWDTASGPDGQRILASHPRIKRLLTENEKKEQEARAAALIRAAEEAKTMKDEQKGGFGQVQHNTRSLQSAMGASSEMRDSYTDFYTSMMGAESSGSSETQGYGTPPNPYAAPPGMPGGRGAYGRMTVVATPDLLLFRFFDFSVVPGNAYVYRVRLKLQNPNYDRDIAELDDPAFREGRFRFTPWSEMSNPAFVQDETEMFLAKVDDKRGVDMDVYQWMTETGTYVKGPFQKLQRGDRIAAIGAEDSRGNMAGQLETEVLRPVNMTFATEKIDYVTANTLVDYEHLTPIIPENHPDLDLGGRRLKLSLDEALTLNQFGELVVLDSASQAARYEAIEARQKQQEELWSHLKSTAVPGGPGAPGGGGIEGLLEGYGSGSSSSSGSYPGMGGGYPGMEGYGIPGESGGKGRRRRSSLKRGAPGGYGSYGGYGSGGSYPGME